jgi:signal transduction histidine kinase
MPTSTFLVYKEPASRAQIRITSGMALALFLVFIAALFVRTRLVNLGLAYIPFTSAFLILADWIIAALLLAQTKALRAPQLAALAAGFFSSGVFVVLRVLSVPSFVTPDPTNNTPLWFYLSSHAALPLAVMAYAWLGWASNQSRPPAAPIHPSSQHLAGAAILVGSLILAATTIETSLLLTSPIFLAGVVVLLLIIAAIVMLGLSLRSVLDLWLLLALWGWFLEVVLIALESKGNTVGWYAGRGLGLASGLFVLFTLIIETNKLYGQTVQELLDQDHQREKRFLIRDAIAASIAHELRQPLSVILLDAHVAQKVSAGENGQMAELLDEIAAAALRANDIIKSTRAMFGREANSKQRVDLEALVRSALAMVQSSARATGVSIDLVVEGQLRPLTGNLLQIQQAMLNLLQNAIEALSRVKGRRRTLTVRCTPNEEEGLTIIRVEDNGPGIAPTDRERIFDPYYTTRTEGTGLGLAITRLVIEAHGGRVGVESLSPYGTAIVIRLPYDDGERGGSTEVIP